MRLFIALKLTESVSVALNGLQKELQPFMEKTNLNVRWTRPDQWHMTLRFLGDQPPQRESALKAALNQIAARSRPAELEWGHYGFFPGRGAVFWLGFAKGQEELHPLAEALNQSLAPLGISLETRPFTPHITLARLKDAPRSLAFRHEVESLPPPTLPPLRVEGLELIQSTLRPEGAHYITRHYVPLAR